MMTIDLVADDVMRFEVRFFERLTVTVPVSYPFLSALTTNALVLVPGSNMMTYSPMGGKTLATRPRIVWPLSFTVTLAYVLTPRASVTLSLVMVRLSALKVIFSTAMES